MGDIDVIGLGTWPAWVGSGNTSLLLLVGMLVGWVAGLLFWWHFSQPSDSDGGDRESPRMRERLAATETTLRERTDEVRGLERQLRETRSGSHEAVGGLRDERDAALRRLDELERDLDTEKAAAASHLAASEHAAKLAAELGAAEMRAARLAEDLQSARAEVAGAATVHADCDARLSRLSSDLDAIRGEKDTEIAMLEQLVANLRSEQTAAADAHDAELRALRDAHNAAAGTHDSAIFSLRAERDAAAARAEEMERRFAGLRAELDGAIARAEALVAERDEAAKRLAAARESDAETGAASEQARAQAATLKRERDEARRDARRQAVDMQREFAESTREAGEQIARLREERKELQRQIRLAAGEVQRLQRAADNGGAAEAEAERLRARLADIEGRHGASLRERDVRIRDLEARLAALNAPASKAPRPERDELQRIHGIGPVLERKLHSLGYLRFEDIAAWKQEEIASIAEQLEAFPDRIERDGWVEQAARLAEEMRRDFA